MLLHSLSHLVTIAWYSILSRVYRAFIGLSDDDVGAVSRTSVEKSKAAALKRESKGMALLLQRAFLMNVTITLCFTALFVYLVVSVSTDGEVNSFDPFSILDIDPGADSKVIRKAFLKRSLEWHPDKNPNNPAAPARFMMVNKAY